LLRRAVELGVTFIDTADSYGPGVSEELRDGPAPAITVPSKQSGQSNGAIDYSTPLHGRQGGTRKPPFAMVYDGAGRLVGEAWKA